MIVDGIPIGESSTIKLIDIDGRQNEAVSIDHHLTETGQLWDALELHCVVECCGIYAFDFYPKTIASAASEINLKGLHEILSKTIRKIEAIDSTILVSERLNYYLDKKDFLKLLAHIQSCVPVQP